MSFRSTVLVATTLISQALSHGIIGEFITDGIRNNGFTTEAIYKIQNGNPVPDTAAWSTEAFDRGYIEPNNVGNLDIVCHKGAIPGVLTAEVTAGGNVDFVWPDWPHNVGPVLTYIASCNGDCASADKSILKWVKIDEAGYDGTWAGQKLMDNNFTWTTRVPSTIAPGNYVFRNEIINLHDGALRNGAQLYPQCMNIRIVGSGTDSPDGLLGTELYKADDTGILFDPYLAKNINYTPPGPPLYSPASLGTPVQTSAISTPGSTLSTSNDSASATIASITSSLYVSVAPSAISNSTTDPASSLTTLATRTRSRLSVIATGATDSATVPLYGQCGGKAYTGPKKCVSGAVCKLFGATYSKCVLV